MLPAIAADPRLDPGVAGRLLGTLDLGALARLVAGVAPISAATGFLTPRLVDRWARDRPGAAGLAYAVNVAGCILGPLLAGFVLLPRLGEVGVLALLALPLLAAGSALAPSRARLAAAAAGVAATALLARGFEITVPGARVLRDATATVVAGEAPGATGAKRLLVNGVGMTALTPITKLMAHLPLAMHGGELRGGTLVVCLGMGTTLRSALAWGAPATAVELVPSVVGAFDVFHADAAAVLASPLARVVVDDGRRFLARSAERFDVVVVDPPPPISAAGSSLLYSKEFYALARARMAPDGILQQWIPGGSPYVVAALVGAVRESFPHVRLFRSIEGWGLHVVASGLPLPRLDAAALAARLPAAAAADLLEWGPEASAEAQFARVVAGEIPLAAAARVPALVDDRPVNEYDLLKRRLERRAPAR
jgi:hypothetical protein